MTSEVVEFVNDKVPHVSYTEQMKSDLAPTRHGLPAETLTRLVATELTNDVSFLLARASSRSLAAGNDALTSFGLKVRSYSVLALSETDERPSQREIAEFLRLDPSQVVSLVDDLEARGLVRRETDPADRRAKVVVATEGGRDLLGRARVAAQHAQQVVHAGLSAEQSAALAALLREIAFDG